MNPNRLDRFLGLVIGFALGATLVLILGMGEPPREEIERQAVAEYLSRQPVAETVAKEPEHVTRIMVNRWVSADHRASWVRELEAVGKSPYHIVPCEATIHIPDGNPNDLTGTWINCFLVVDLGGTSDAPGSPSRPDQVPDG